MLKQKSTYFKFATSHVLPLIGLMLATHMASAWPTWDASSQLCTHINTQTHIS